MPQSRPDAAASPASDPAPADRALEECVRRLAPRLLRYCRGRLERTADAEELAQETLCVLVERWRRLGPPQNPEAFVFVIARRRAARVAVKTALLQPLELLGDRASRLPLPDDQAEALEARGQLRCELARLPLREREAMLLVFGAGLDHDDAAAVLGIGRSALKMRIHRAKKRLATRLEPIHDPARP